MKYIALLLLTFVAVSSAASLPNLPESYYTAVEINEVDTNRTIHAYQWMDAIVNRTRIDYWRGGLPEHLLFEFNKNTYYSAYNGTCNTSTIGNRAWRAEFVTAIFHESTKHDYTLSGPEIVRGILSYRYQAQVVEPIPNGGGATRSYTLSWFFAVPTWDFRGTSAHNIPVRARRVGTTSTNQAFDRYWDFIDFQVLVPSADAFTIPRNVFCPSLVQQPIPSLPTSYQFQAEWTDEGSNTTVFVNEFFDGATGRVRTDLQRHDYDEISIVDPVRNRTYFIAAGNCSAHYASNSIVNRFEFVANFLSSSIAQNFTYGGQTWHRGTPADRWRSGLITRSPNNWRPGMDYTLEWHFQIANWNHPYANGARIPLRLWLQGTEWRLQNGVKQVTGTVARNFEFFEFIGSVPSSDVFSPPRHTFCADPDRNTLPVFPLDFSSRLEANLGGRQQTISMRQYFDTTNGRVRIDEIDTQETRVQIYRTKIQRWYDIVNGSCTVRNTSDPNGRRLQNFLEMYQQSIQVPYTYGGNYHRIRSISADMWRSDVQSFGTTRGSDFVYEYYFASTSWNMPSASPAYRIPLAIYVNGTHWQRVNGVKVINRTFVNEYQIVDFVPGQPDPAVYEVDESIFCPELIQRSLPALPQTFSVEIEANLNNSTSLNIVEYYDYQNNLLRLENHRFNHSTIEIYNYNTNRAYTYNHHFCRMFDPRQEVRPGPNFADNNDHLRSSLDFFFSAGTNFSYGGTKIVREVVCDRWRSNLVNQYNATTNRGTEYWVEWSFATQEYQSIGIPLNGFRIPRRAEVSGRHYHMTNGVKNYTRSFYHIYAFVGFSPTQPDASLFTPPDTVFCVDLAQQPLPQFPSAFSVELEANLNNMTTFTVTEYYDNPNNRLRLENRRTNSTRIEIFNYNQNTAYIYNGDRCRTVDTRTLVQPGFGFTDSTGHLRSSLSFFASDNLNFRYGGQKYVREVLCDRWRSNVTIQYNETTNRGTHYWVEWSFAALGYNPNFRRPTPWRIPRRAEVSGFHFTRVNGQANVTSTFYHWYTFVDFVPQIPDPALFDHPVELFCPALQNKPFPNLAPPNFQAVVEINDKVRAATYTRREYLDSDQKKARIDTYINNTRTEMIVDLRNSKQYTITDRSKCEVKDLANDPESFARWTEAFSRQYLDPKYLTNATYGGLATARGIVCDIWRVPYTDTWVRGSIVGTYLWYFSSQSWRLHSQNPDIGYPVRATLQGSYIMNGVSYQLDSVYDFVDIIEGRNADWVYRLPGVCPGGSDSTETTTILSNGVGDGAAAGIGIGLFVLGVLVGLLALFFACRKRIQGHSQLNDRAVSRETSLDNTDLQLQSGEVEIK